MKRKIRYKFEECFVVRRIIWINVVAVAEERSGDDKIRAKYHRIKMKSFYSIISVLQEHCSLAESDRVLVFVTTFKLRLSCRQVQNI